MNLQIINKKIIFFLFFLCSLPAQAVSIKNEINLTWMADNFQQVEKTVSGNRSYELIPVINTLSEIWHRRDGATTGEVSTLIIRALIFHPELMLPMLADKPDSFERWLSQFNGIIFTDYSGDTFDELKLLHKQLTESMLNVSNSCDSGLTHYANRILKQLTITEIKRID